MLVRVRLLVFGQVAPARNDQPLRVDHPAARPRHVRCQAVLDHGHDQQIRDPGGGFACTKAEECLLRHALARDALRRHYASDRDRGGALDVVVETADLVAVTPQQPECVVVREILELHDDPREDFLRRRDEFLDQRIVGRPGQAPLAQAEIQRIRQQGRVVRADVEHDRQAAPGMQPGARGVQREFADGDAHAVRTEVTEPQDALAIGHDDHRGLAMRPVAHDLRDATAIVGAR